MKNKPDPMKNGITVGGNVNIVPWCYEWRRDKKIQQKPEAYFIPRRLERIDKVYRTAFDALGTEQLKSIFYTQNDLLEKLLPSPEYPLLAGELWVGGISDYTVKLTWEKQAPNPDDIEVRTYPTAWGWFGWTVDKIMQRTDLSDDGKTMIFSPRKDAEMDFAYSQRVKAATQMICIFAKENVDVPEIEISGDSLGQWKKFEFRAEWGFNEVEFPFEGEFDSHVSVVEMTGLDKNKKTAEFSCYYSDTGRYGNDSKVTLIADKIAGVGATVLLRELAAGPICIPELGLYLAPAGCKLSAVQYIEQCKDQNKMTVAQRVRQHKEAETWEEYFNNTRLWRCPDGTEVPEFDSSYIPKVDFTIPDKRWQTMYRLAVKQLTGHNMWGFLSCEVCHVTAAMEKVGLTEQADAIYDYFFQAPGVKSDGDFSDPAGSFEWAKGMRHDMGYSHEGTHCSTGGLIISMMRRYHLQRDEKWLNEHLARIKSAADWIIRQTDEYASDFPNREQLFCYGLMPPSMVGDYALPACDWHWYYIDNAEAYGGVLALAEVLESIHDQDAPYYREKAAQFGKHLIRAVKAEALYAPVRRAGDGMSRSFLPKIAYGGGLLHYQDETNIPDFGMGICELFKGGLPLANENIVLDANDRRIVGTITAMEELALHTTLDSLEKLAHPTADAKSRDEAALLAEQSGKMVRTSTPPKEDVWFWNTFSNLPKISYNANTYLAQDDIPNFLRFFFNHAIVMVGSNGMMWEHAHPDIYVECENPDNGTAGWFVENFRNMLIMEQGNILWLTRGIPRSWLQQGKIIKGEQIPTDFGNVDFAVKSELDHGRIDVEIHIPEDFSGVVKMRFRHPESKKIVAVSGVRNNVLPDGETVEIAPECGKLIFKVLY